MLYYLNTNYMSTIIVSLCFASYRCYYLTLQFMMAINTLLPLNAVRAVEDKNLGIIDKNAINRNNDNINLQDHLPFGVSSTSILSLFFLNYAFIFAFRRFMSINQSSRHILCL